MTIKSLVARLEQDFDAIAHQALVAASQDLASATRSAFSTLPGGPHEHPWLQSGALRDSIGCTVEGLDAIVGSSSEVARYQEHGTDAMPPRPTFAPVATAEAPKIGEAIATKVVQSLRGA